MQEALPIDDIGEGNDGPEMGDDGTSQAPLEVSIVSSPNFDLGTILAEPNA